MEFVFDVGVAVDVGGGIHLLNIVGAPEVVVGHSEEFQNSVFS